MFNAPMVGSVKNIFVMFISGSSSYSVSPSTKFLLIGVDVMNIYFFVLLYTDK